MVANNSFAPHLRKELLRWESLFIKQCGLVRHHPEGARRFRQRDLWSFHFYHYHGSLEVGGEVAEFGPGSVSLIPPGQVVAWRFPRVALHHYVHFSVAPSSDFTEGVLLGLPSKGQPVREALDFAVAQSDQHRRAAELRFHDLLWRLSLESATSSPEEPSASSTLQIALSLIRNEMGRGIRVGDVARQCGVSRGHLNRVFQMAFGQSTQSYLQDRRAELVRELLENSEEPIVAVAAQAGFDDLQAFNKFVRRRLGASPRSVQAGQSGLASQSS